MTEYGQFLVYIVKVIFVVGYSLAIILLTNYPTITVFVGKLTLSSL